MDIEKNVIALAALACALPAALHAQFLIAGRPVQIHGFASQGFAYSSDNNYLTMNTSDGSFKFTDGGLNMSVPITDKLHVGAQIYIRSIGTQGQWHPVLDWAVADYKFKGWFGARAGKVKTTLGLYTDTQDMEFLHTWAILPQALYPLDLRSETISHLGGDIYGEIPLKRYLGSLTYTAYVGRLSDDKHGGYRDVALQNGRQLKDFSGWIGGADLRWNSPLPGLTVGMSWMNQSFGGDGTVLTTSTPFTFAKQGRAYVYYADYVRGNLHLTGEYSKNPAATLYFTGVPGLPVRQRDARAWSASAAYRISKHLELGTYHSRFISDANKDWSALSNHIYDQTVTARVDINRHWNFKAEGHFIDGYGSIYSAHGFYLGQNPHGYQPKTNMLVLRAGFNF
jgi:hypothetical protein